MFQKKKGQLYYLKVIRLSENKRKVATFRLKMLGQRNGSAIFRPIRDSEIMKPMKPANFETAKQDEPENQIFNSHERIWDLSLKRLGNKLRKNKKAEFKIRLNFFKAVPFKFMETIRYQLK